MEFQGGVNSNLSWRGDLSEAGYTLMSLLTVVSSLLEFSGLYFI